MTLPDTNNPDLNTALQFGIDPALESHPSWDRISWGVSVLRDMAHKLIRYGSLSYKQATFATKLHKESLQKMKWAEDRIEEAKQRVAQGIRAPEGRCEVTGKLISQKSRFSTYGETIKCLIELPDGAKVWGTKPSSASTENGKHIRFVATFKPSEDDPSFGFYSRPSNWSEVA